MAFESQIGRRMKNSQRTSIPSVRFRRTMSGAGGGQISKSVPLHQSRIDIQIDKERKLIRIGKNEGGVSCGKQGSFSCSLSVFLEIGNGKIILDQGSDGWWYGSYADNAND